MNSLLQQNQQLAERVTQLRPLSKIQRVFALTVQERFKRL